MYLKICRNYNDFFVLSCVNCWLKYDFSCNKNLERDLGKCRELNSRHEARIESLQNGAEAEKRHLEESVDSLREECPKLRDENESANAEIVKLHNFTAKTPVPSRDLPRVLFSVIQKGHIFLTRTKIMLVVEFGQFTRRVTNTSKVNVISLDNLRNIIVKTPSARRSILAREYAARPAHGRRWKMASKRYSSTILYILKVFAMSTKIKVMCRVKIMPPSQ